MCAALPAPSEVVLALLPTNLEIIIREHIFSVTKNRKILYLIMKINVKIVTKKP
jgi:hypothetical protein